MKRNLIGISALLALCATLLVSQVAQNTATVTGTVSNPAGAAVPNAYVQLQSGTRVFTASSSGTGAYRFASLPSGAFELTVTASGFQRYAAKFNLTNGQQLRHDVRLQAVATSTSVTDEKRAGQRTEQGVVIINGTPSNAEAPKAVGAAKGGAKGVAMAPPVPQAMRAQIAGAYDQFGRLNEISRYPIPPYPGRPGVGNEEYGHYVENPFTTPADEPLSTFAVDVDTASYSNIRRFLNDGQLPPAESVRIEELINYFSYDYALPERGKPVSMTTNVVRSPWNPGRLLMHVALRTQPIAAEDLPPSNLTFLVDVSGSMSSPDKLPLVKQALQMLARQMRSQDRVAMVVYAGTSGMVLPPTPGNRTEVILEAIERLGAGGSTNGAGGIRQAYAVARQAFNSKGNNRVILATDGDFNVGVSSDDELVRLIEQERKSGIFLSVFGVGTGNLKDSKMEKLADHGNGTYAYLDSLSEARKVFVQELGATLVTVAKDVKLQIEFNPARVKEYRLIGYENRMLRPEDFNNDAKDAGDLGAGHQVTAFYEIIPTGSSESGGSVDPLRYGRPATTPQQPAPVRSNELGWVKLRHKAPQSETSALLEWPIPAQTADFRNAPRDVRFAAAVAEYGLVLRHSKYAGVASFDHALETASNALGSDLNGNRTEFLDLVRKAARLSGRQLR